MRFAKPSDEDRAAFQESNGFIASDSDKTKDIRVKGKYAFCNCYYLMTRYAKLQHGCQ